MDEGHLCPSAVTVSLGLLGGAGAGGTHPPWADNTGARAGGGLEVGSPPHPLRETLDGDSREAEGVERLVEVTSQATH